MTSRRAAAPLAVALALLTSEARADDARCIAAFESTQLLRREGKLAAARAEALLCSAPSCPRVVVPDCATWFGEIEAAMPTAVFAATSGARELIEVEVLVDGAPVTRRLDGRARPLDPGPHRVRFESAGHRATEVSVVVVEGEKNRKISAALVPEAPVAASSDGPIPVLSWVLGGVGLAAFTGTAIFAADGLGRRSDLDARGCEPSCAEADVDATTRSFLVADVLAGVGLVAVASAIVVYVTRPAATPSTQASAPPLGAFVF